MRTSLRQWSSDEFELEQPGFASGILVLERPTPRKINGREQAASFAGNGSKKRVATSASAS
jgi:hypothetical protein